MLHPSYAELMQVVNEEAEGDTPVVNSRYSIVLATSKRARQIASGATVKTDAKDRSVVTLAATEIAEGKVEKISETEE